jgi:hypothetical protein
MTSFTALHDHFDAGLSFEEAKRRAGFGACSCGVAILLARYWNLLEMEAATASAAVYFDLLLSMEGA